MPHELTSHIEVNSIRIILIILILKCLVLRVLLRLDVFLVALRMLGLLLGVGSQALLIGADKLRPQHPIPVVVIHVTVPRVNIIGKDL